MRGLARLAFVVLIGCGGGGTSEALPDAPSDDAAIDAPAIDAPGADALELDALDVDAIELDAPELDAPDIDAPVDAAVDAPIDATIDAPVPSQPFAIAFVSDWTFRNINGVGTLSVGMIVNRSETEAMDLSQLAVIQVMDDSEAIGVSISIQGNLGFSVPPGEGAGRLSNAAAALILPLAPEPRINTDSPVFGFMIHDIPTGFDGTVHAHAIVRNGTEAVTLPFAFTFSSAAGPSVEITRARRMLSTPF